MPEGQKKCARCGFEEEDLLLMVDVAGYDWCIECLQTFLRIFGEDALSSWPEAELAEKLLKWARVDQQLDSLDWFRKIMRDIPGGY